MPYAFLAGRLLFGFFHLASALNHFKSLDSYAQHAALKKVPAPKLAIIGSGLLLLAGGLSILLGLRPPLGVAALALFYVGVTPVMHNFWAAAPDQKQPELINFMKNVGAPRRDADVPGHPAAVGVQRGRVRVTPP